MARSFGWLQAPQGGMPNFYQSLFSSFFLEGSCRLKTLNLKKKKKKRKKKEKKMKKKRKKKEEKKKKKRRKKKSLFTIFYTNYG